MLLDVELLDKIPTTSVPINGKLQLRNVTFADTENTTSIKRISTVVDLGKHLQIIGDNNSGRSDLAGLIARFYQPSSGSILLNGIEMSTLPQSVTGRKISYAGQVSYLFSGTIFDNVVYGLQHTLTHAESEDWNDYEMAGVDDLDSLKDKVIDLIDELGFSADLFRFGMSSRLKRNSNGTVISDIKRARQAMLDRIDGGELSRLVEPFNKDEYNVNMSVAENLLFGNLKDDNYSVKNLYKLPLVKTVFKETGLDADFKNIGFQLAELMVELFADVEPGSELFDQFSFVGPDELVDLQKLLSRGETGRGKKTMTKAESELVSSLPFRLTVSRHRLGLVDAAMQAKVVKARKILMQRLQNYPIDYIPFSADEYQPSLSVQENILFGKVVYGQAYAEDKVVDAIDETVRDIGIYRKIVATGLDYEVGVGGARLSAALRQGLVLCRCLIKRPDVLILNQATNAFDDSAEKRIIKVLREKQKGKSLVLVSGTNSMDDSFEQHIFLDEGRIVDT